MKDAQKEKKPLSKRDKVLLVIAGIGLTIALCCQGWYCWPWIGANVYRASSYDWNAYSPSQVDVASLGEIPSIKNTSPYTKRQVIKYFKDIVLRMEFDSSVHYCHKWTTPIKLCILDSPNEEDLRVVLEVCAFLNQIPGFPGISQTETPEEANILLHFRNDDTFAELAPDNFNGYFNLDAETKLGELSHVTIGIRNSLNREKKTSVIWEELLQATGPFNDTLLTSDTLFYNGDGDIPRASELDRTLLSMLYHPLIQAGTDYIYCFPIFMEYLR